jgi:WD40 repeat protein
MSGISERNPFVGPRPIQQGETLHGRDTELRGLFNRLQARRIVVLHSPSGAGKSSLVQAGLIPRLREAGYDVWKPIRVNLDPSCLEGIPPGTNRYLLSAMISLEDELPTERRRTPAQLAGLDLLAYIEGRPRRKGQKDRPVVLVFDQFEEVLTTAPLVVTDKQEFFTAVGVALGSEKHWALFVIREDYLAAFAPYRDRIPTQMSTTFRLDLLDLAGARAAATNLAAQGGRSFPAVDRLIRDLSMMQVQQADGSFVAEQGLYVEPVQLQVVCRRLWDAMPADDRRIDPEHIEAYASVSTALASYYADAARSIAEGDVAAERAIRDWFGRRLIVGGIRSQVRREERRSAGLDNRLIERLLDTYLVRTEQRAGAHWFELSHDRLVAPVHEDNLAWEQAHLHPLQVQAKLWEDGKRPAALLLGAEALQGAQAWAQANPTLLTEGERDFLGQSRELRARDRAARRRLVALAAAAAVVAVVVAVLAVVAWRARASAVAAETEAVSQRDAAKAAEETAKNAEEVARKAEAEALVQALRAQDASLMAGVRELLARGQAAPATRLLLAVREPRSVRGWPELAQEILAMSLPFVTLRGHTAEVQSAAWSPDGRRIVTASSDMTARVWSADGTGEPVVLRGHEGLLRSAAWSPDGQRIVTASADRTARVWSADGTGELAILSGHQGDVTIAAWSPDGQWIVTASTDKTARLWPPDGTSTVLRGHTDEVWHAAWSPDGQRIVTASRDKTARVWHVDGRGKGVSLKGHEDAVDFAAWSPDGQRIVTASRDKTARVWNADGTPRVVGVGKQRSPLVLRGHEDVVWSATWSRDGRRIVTASRDGTARVWTTEKAIVLSGHEHGVHFAAWDPRGNRVLGVSRGNTPLVWGIDYFLLVGHKEATLVGHEGGVTSAAWSPDGRRVVTTSNDRTVRVWQADRRWRPDAREPNEATAAWMWDEGDEALEEAAADARDEPPFEALAPALRDATTDCLSPKMRSTYLNEPPPAAALAYDKCEREHGRLPFYTSTQEALRKAILKGASVQRGDTCSPGSRPVTHTEARAAVQDLCGLLGEWAIIRLADGRSMDGPGYGCKIRANPDTRGHGEILCVPSDAPLPAVPHDGPPPASERPRVPGSFASRAVVQDGQACLAGSRPVTHTEAQGAAQGLCPLLGEWASVRLADGRSMDGGGYGCKVRTVADDRTLGQVLCVASE